MQIVEDKLAPTFESSLIFVRCIASSKLFESVLKCKLNLSLENKNVCLDASPFWGTRRCILESVDKSKR